MTSASNDALRGAPWMLAGTVCFAASAIAVKQIGPDLPSTVLAFFRAFFGLIVVIPLIARHGFVIFRTNRPGMHFIRVLGATGSVVFSYYAVAHLPLATAVSLSFTRPLFMIVIAALFLGEVVRWRRGLATVIGFAGVLIMLGPTDVAFSLPAIAALAGAASVSVALAVIRQHAATEGYLAFIAWFVVGSAVLMAPIAAFFWQTPHGIQWAYLVFIGVSSSTGQFFLIKAFSMAEATVMAPIDYAQIIIAAVAGYFLFGEIPSVWMALGAAVIVAATLYILFREAALKVPPAPPAATE